MDKTSWAYRQGGKVDIDNIHQTCFSGVVDFLLLLFDRLLTREFSVYNFPPHKQNQRSLKSVICQIVGEYCRDNKQEKNSGSGFKSK